MYRLSKKKQKGRLKIMIIKKKRIKSPVLQITALYTNFACEGFTKEAFSGLKLEQKKRVLSARAKKKRHDVNLLVSFLEDNMISPHDGSNDNLEFQECQVAANTSSEKSIQGYYYQN